MFFHLLMVHCQMRAVAASVVPPASFRIFVTSSLSRMLKAGFRPSTAPSSRIMRTPSAWKVQTTTCLRVAPDQPLGALAHFGRGLVGEGDGRDALGLQSGLDQPRDLVRDDARLARARAGEHEAGAVHVVDGFLLREIETGGHGGGAGGGGAKRAMIRGTVVRPEM